VTQAAPVLSPRLLPYAACSAAVCVIGLVICNRISTAAMYGASFAALGALVALPLVVWGTPRGTNALLGGFVAGFFARMIVVAAGLLASHAQGQAALQYAFSFFALYGLTQVVEVAYVWNASRERPVEAP
jgi:hypothetical protein